MLFLLTTVTLMSAEKPSSMPKRLSAYIGGFMGGYQVELRNGSLTCTTFGGGTSKPKRATVTPTAMQWREFRQTLDDLNVWQWRADYPNDRTIDGWQWTLNVGYADRTIKTRGDNNYPDSVGKPNGEPEPTKAFDRYLEAVRKLTGGMPFGR